MLSLKNGCVTNTNHFESNSVAVLGFSSSVLLLEVKHSNMCYILIIEDNIQDGNFS